MDRTPRERLAELARAPDHAIDLAEAALLIAAEAYPDLDVPAYIHQLDALAGEARCAITTAGGGAQAVAQLNHFLFAEKRFVGNQKDYYDRRNSFLNEVLDRRTGIPLTLTLVYMEVARRVGLRVEGVSFPGHFLAKYVGDDEIIIDAFFGRVLTEEQCEERLQAVLGPGAVFEPRYLEAAGPKDILVRMLRNLKHIYLNAAEYEQALACCDRVLLLSPDLPHELRDRGLVYQQLECYGAAVSDLERFLRLAPSDDSADTIREELVKLRKLAAQIH